MKTLCGIVLSLGITAMATPTLTAQSNSLMSSAAGAASGVRESLSSGIALLLPTQAKGTVYVYRADPAGFKAEHPELYCDNLKIAKILAGGFVKMELSPGQHVIYAAVKKSDKSDAATISVEAGKVYYFNVFYQPSAWLAHFQIELKMPEQAQFDLARLKPL